MSRLAEYEHVGVHDYADAQKYLVQGSIVMDLEYCVPYLVEVTEHANGSVMYGYYEDGIGQVLMLDGSPYKLPRGDVEEYVTLYTPQN